jgi:DNA repair protein RadC
MVSDFMYEFEIVKNKKNCFEFESVVTCSKSAEFVLRQIFNNINVREYVYALFFDRAMNLQGYYQVSVGGISSSVCCVRLIAHIAVQNLSSSVMLAHNHPSGSLKLSESDHHITKKLKQALQTLDMCLQDHIILTENAYISMSDSGLM